MALTLALLAIVGMAGCGPVAAFQEARQPVFTARELFPKDLAPQVAANASGPVTDPVYLDGTEHEQDCSIYWLPGYEPRDCVIALYGYYGTGDRELAAMVMVYVMTDAEYASDFFGRSLASSVSLDVQEFAGGLVGRYCVDIRVFDRTGGPRLGPDTPDLSPELRPRAMALAEGMRMAVEAVLKQRVGL